MTILGKISKIESGDGFPKNYQKYKSKNIPFIKVSDMNKIGNDKFIFETAFSVDQKILSKIKAKSHQIGTLIFPKIGGAISTNKKRLLSKVSAYDNNIVGIIPSKKLLSEYLYNFFKTIDLYELSNKASLPSINNSSIQNTEINLPNLNEQSKINDKLKLIDKHFSLLIDNIQLKLKNLSSLKMSFLNKEIHKKNNE